MVPSQPVKRSVPPQDKYLRDLSEESEKKVEAPALGEYQMRDNWNHKVKKDVLRKKQSSQKSMQKKQNSVLDDFKNEMQALGVEFNEQDYLNDPDVREIIHQESSRKLNELYDEGDNADPNELDNLWRDTEAVRANQDNIFKDEREILLRFINTNPEGLLKLKDFYAKRDQKLKKIENMKEKDDIERFEEKVIVEKFKDKSLLK